MQVSPHKRLIVISPSMNHRHRNAESNARTYNSSRRYPFESFKPLTPQQLTQGSRSNLCIYSDKLCIHPLTETTALTNPIQDHHLTNTYNNATTYYQVPNTYLYNRARSILKSFHVFTTQCTTHHSLYRSKQYHPTVLFPAVKSSFSNTLNECYAS